MKTYAPKEAVLKYLAIVSACGIASAVALVFWNFLGIPGKWPPHLFSLLFGVPETIAILFSLVPCFQTTGSFVLPYYLALLLPTFFALRMQSQPKRKALLSLQALLCLMHVVASLVYSISVFEHSVPVDVESEQAVTIEEESN